MNDTPDRRKFLGRALGTAAGLATAMSESDAAQEQRLAIVDTHQHLWDLNRFRLPWIQKGSPLARSFVMKDYLNATAGLNVVKAIYMEVDVDPSQQQAEADYVIDICRRGKSPTVAAVISGRPASSGFEKYVSSYRGHRYIKGLRQVLHNKGTPAGYCLAPAFVKGIRLLGELGLSFDLCVRSSELGDAVKLIEACPHTRFILDHCGNASVQARDLNQWRRDMARVARCRNVVGKVSGIVASARPGKWTADDLAPIINHTLDVFGPDRVMFGGDWPVCTLAASYRQWVEALKHVVRNRPIADRRKLFHDNAVKFYGLT
jgi:predicted TIM-barrel fold metal-dependent hydrolase